MNVTAMLSWWNETGPELDTLIPSLAGLADTLVAYDGGYHGQPGATPSSPHNQHERITQLAHDHGIDAYTFSPAQLWRGEVHKRQALLAHTLRRQPNWVLAVDADWKIEGHHKVTRQLLASTPKHVVMVPYFTPVPEGVDADDLAPHEWHRWAARRGRPEMYPLLLRALPGLHMVEHHWWYLAPHPKHVGKTLALCGGDQRHEPALAPAHTNGVKVIHRCFYRARHQLRDRRRFYHHRDALVKNEGTER